MFKFIRKFPKKKKGCGLEEHTKRNPNPFSKPKFNRIEVREKLSCTSQISQKSYKLVCLDQVYILPKMFE